jgi:hypothetical protein
MRHLTLLGYSMPESWPYVFILTLLRAPAVSIWVLISCMFQPDLGKLSSAKSYS